MAKFIEIHEKDERTPGEYLIYFLNVEDINFVGDLGGSAFVFVGDKGFDCLETYGEVRAMLSEAPEYSAASGERLLQEKAK